MAKEYYDKEIDKNVDWGGDETTGGIPVKGSRVQEFIKKQLEGKMGIFYYDTSNNRYLVFSDEFSRDLYLEDPVNNSSLLLGNFDAPFNYEATLDILSGTYNAIQLGSVGNYIEFTYDIKNKQGVSTGENVIVTYTIIRNSTKKVINETHLYGETVRFNLDDYLGEGTNTIILGIQGQTTLAATTAAITYQVVNLSLTDEVNISKIYDLSKVTATYIEIPFTLSGSGTKVVEWYIDGEKLDFIKEEDEVVDISTSRVKYITLSNLQQGIHNLQFQAYTIINGEKFYTKVLYRDFIVYTGVNQDQMIGVAAEIPEIQESLVIYDIEQYVPYKLRFSTYKTGEVSIYLGDDLKGVITSESDTENIYTITSEISGNISIKLVSEGVEYIIPCHISPTSMNISAITSGLEFDFSSVGRSNLSSDRNKFEYNGFRGTFSGFSWNDTSGWVGNRLLMTSGASFTTDYAPLSGKPTDTGKTIELEFSTLNVRNDDAIICDLRDKDGTGLYITATKVSLVSHNGVVVETEFRSGENVRVVFVINRKNGSQNKCLSFIYANGIISRCEQWSPLDSYTSTLPIKFKSTSEVEISLKAIRVYNNALTSDQILNNYILYRDSIEEMSAIYDRNNVYIEGTTNFSTEKMMSRIPVMIVTGDIPVLENTSDKNTQITVDIDYYNMQDPTRNFSMVNAAMRPQGTSSMGYPKKNFRVYTKKIDDTILYDSEGKVVKDKLYAFKDGSQPVNTWCLKADYAESSGTHNTGIARLWNKALYNVQIDGEYVCRTEAQKEALKSEYPYDVRTAIDGFPILLFYRKTKNDDLIFIGKYNFNNDKSTESVFGFKGIPGFDNSRMQCWEVLNNGNAIALFNSIEDFDTSWSEAFESRYPDTDKPNTTDLKSFCTWMTTVNSDDFSTQKWDHLDVYKISAYYVYLMRHAGVDQFVKNAMFTSEDGVHFYYIHYDNDTINGLINTGKLNVTPTDDRQTIDESGSYLFAGHDSRLWNMLEADEEFMEIVKKMDNALYSAGISYLNTIKTFDEEQSDKWVERVYNQDAQYKYIGPFSEKGIDNLFMLQGKRDLHRKWWLSKRFSIYDAKWITGPYKSQAIEFKCINGTPEGQSFTITSGYPINYGYGINDLPRETGVYLDINESHTFTTREVINLGDPVRIYGAANIKSVDLSQVMNRIAVINISNVYDDHLGTCLTDLILGGSGVRNKEVTNISGLKQATKLEYLNVEGLENLSSLDISNHPYLRELRASKSGIASIILTKGSPLNLISLPKTVTNLNFEQLPSLSCENIILDDIKTVNTINIKDCPLVSNNFDFIYDWYSSKNTSSELCSLTMNNVNWMNIDTAKLLDLGNLGTLKLKGRIKLTEVTETQLSELQTVFGDNIFNQSSELYIIAPPAVYLVGPLSLTEGETGQYQCVVAGAELQSASFSITSGGNSYYMTLNSETGVLTTKDGAGGYNPTIQLIARTKKEGETKVTTTTKTMTTKILSKTYPSSSDTTILGEDKLGAENVYTIKHTATYTGDFNVSWSLSGFDGYAEISSSNKTSCTITRLQNTTTVISGTLSAVFTKVYNGSTVLTLTKSLQLINEDIAVADAKIAKIFYDAGLCANSTYITKEEAALITEEDIQPGTTKDTSIFRSLGNNDIIYCDFSGFQYFTGITTIKPNMFSHEQFRYFTKIIFPNTITSISGYVAAIHFILNEGLTTMTERIELVKGNNAYLYIPDTLINSKILVDVLGSSRKITIEGGNNLSNPIILTYNYNNDATNNLIINSNNLRAYALGGPFNNGKWHFVVGGDAGLPTTVTAPSGGYFEDGSTTQDIILNKIRDNVYEAANVVYKATVIINTNMSSQNPDFLITYTNHNNEEVQITVKVGTYILPIKYGTTVKVSAITEIENTTLSVKEYTWNYTSNTCSNTFIINYVEGTDIYIQHIDGTLYTTDQWTSGGYANEDANGVAVVRPVSSSFVIAKEQSSSSLAWGGYWTIITDIGTFSSRSIAALDNDGAGNTHKIIEQLTGTTDREGIVGAPAAEYCAGYTFPNGKTGYLGALGELKVVCDNRTKINSAMSLIGGTAISKYAYWSSTQYNDTASWYLSFEWSTLEYDGKKYTRTVRAFCSLS